MAISCAQCVSRNMDNKPSRHERDVLYSCLRTEHVALQTFQGYKMTTRTERYYLSSSLPSWFCSPSDRVSMNLLNASMDDCDTFLGLISSISSSVIILQTSPYQNRSVSRGRYTFATYQNLESVNTSTATATTRTMFSAAWSIMLVVPVPKILRYIRKIRRFFVQTVFQYTTDDCRYEDAEVDFAWLIE